MAVHPNGDIYILTKNFELNGLRPVVGPARLGVPGDCLCDARGDTPPERPLAPEEHQDQMERVGREDPERGARNAPEEAVLQRRGEHDVRARAGDGGARQRGEAQRCRSILEADELHLQREGAGGERVVAGGVGGAQDHQVAQQIIK
jgi:hypothetical protein